ncbi:hypothetical protein FS837_010449 [Tulasnella sp. UAMH 9824]|nr:hypothetical protein FS837_010449 [Tulasnella sp. UAMH 9824]
MHLFSLFVSFVAVVGAFAQTTTTTGVPDPSINTPTGVIQCQPVQLTYSGTAPPFIITVMPGGQTDVAPLVSLGPTSENAITWVANLSPNNNYTLVIRDQMGRTNPSAPFMIYPGTTTNCPAPSQAPAASQTPAANPVRIRGRAVYL